MRRARILRLKDALVPLGLVTPAILGADSVMGQRNQDAHFPALLCCCVCHQYSIKQPEHLTLFDVELPG